jgi:Sodium/hydrogen exchanger family
MAEQRCKPQKSAVLAGNTTDVSIILGACLALSSTAIVVEVLSNQGRLATAAGRASFSVLLAQDLAVIPILLFVSILGTGASRSVMTSLALALLNAALAVGAIVIIGRLFLRPLFRLVAATGTNELFVAAALFVIVGTGVAAALSQPSSASSASSPSCSPALLGYFVRHGLPRSRLVFSSGPVANSHSSASVWPRRSGLLMPMYRASP